jgi:dCMP deaminase
MTLKKDKLYEEHRSMNAGEDIEALIVNFANSNGEKAQEHVMQVLNMVKTCSTLEYKYTDCLKEIEENYGGLPLEIVNAIVMAHIGDKPSIKVNVDSYSVNDEPFESWDEFYYNVARQIARNSKCLSRRIGAILVKDKLIIATGYNGPPRGIMKCDVRTDLIEQGIELQEGVCPRRTMGFPSGKGIEVCIAAHAEANCINMCARKGIASEGATMYMTCGIPCKECMIKIIQAGIEELVVTSMDLYDQLSGWLLENSEVKVRLFDFIEK